MQKYIDEIKTIKETLLGKFKELESRVQVLQKENDSLYNQVVELEKLKCPITTASEDKTIVKCELLLKKFEEA